MTQSNDIPLMNQVLKCETCEISVDGGDLISSYVDGGSVDLAIYARENRTISVVVLHYYTGKKF